MAHNRKSQWAGLRYGAMLKALLFCGVIGGLGLGYVWQQQQVYKLGDLKTRAEFRRDEARKQNDNLRRILAGLEDPRALEERARKLNLGLRLPTPDQILRLPERASERKILPAPKGSGVNLVQNGKKP